MSRHTEGEIMWKDGREVMIRGWLPEAEAAYLIAEENGNDTAVEISLTHHHVRCVPTQDDGFTHYFVRCPAGRGAFRVTSATYHDTDAPIDRCAHPDPIHGGYRSYSSHRWCSNHRREVSP